MKTLPERETAATFSLTCDWRYRIKSDANRTLGVMEFNYTSLHIGRRWMPNWDDPLNRDF